jgi:hypothetical protein
MKLKFNFSKFIVIISIILFIISVGLGLKFTKEGLDTSIFNLIIPSISAVLTASVIFYFNKSKMENVLKILITSMKARLSLQIKVEKVVEDEKYIIIKDIINNEFSILESELNSKINSVYSEEVNKDITDNF